MIPTVILHNSVSLDNAILGFDIDLGVHYGTLMQFEPDAVLAGSATARFGIEMFMDDIPPEEESDLIRPAATPDDRRPVEVLVDSRGRLKHLLHIFRRLEYVKDVILLVSDTTPGDYLEYLRERDYPFIRCGGDHVDLRMALRRLRQEFGISKIVTDSGGRLNGVLIEEKIADELSLLVFPVLAGHPQKKLFESIESPVTLTLIRSELLDAGILHLRYAFSDSDDGQE